MPEIALADGQSLVQCTDGVQGSVCSTSPPKWFWDSPFVSKSGPGSTSVFINNFPVVRKDDTMEAHPDGVPCTSNPINHTPFLSTYSSTVFIEGKEVGRKGDKYNGGTVFDHEITTGSSTVFVG